MLFSMHVVENLGNNEVIVEEGLAKIIIPNPEKYKRPDGVLEPAWFPVFYNPLMKLNRDLTILVVRESFKSGFFIEALGGTGVRGVRLAVEAGLDGIINDVDPLAYRYIRRNIRLNKLEDKVYPYMHEANSLLNNFTFTGIVVDYLDIDPYGSPIPYIDSAVKPLGKKSLLGVTATDTGPLTCSHPAKMLRRYGVRCVDTDFSKELGLRVLIYNLVFRAAGQDVALKPIMSYNYKYYYRVFFASERRARSAFRILDECRGYIWFCSDNYDRKIIREPVLIEKNCKHQHVIGPLWICRLGDKEFIDRISRVTDPLYSEATSLARKLIDEIDIDQPYFRYDKLFGYHKKNMPPIDVFIKKLKELGYKATRTHFDPRGVKTNASILEIHKIISSWTS